MSTATGRKTLLQFFGPTGDRPAPITCRVSYESRHTRLWLRASPWPNNHYLKILKKSALWEVSCGPAAYDKVAELVAFNLRAWIDKNIDWESDLDLAVVSDLRKSDLLKYLRW